MDKFERRRFEQFDRVAAFGVSRHGDFPAGSRGHELFTLLTKIVSQLEAADTGLAVWNDRVNKCMAVRAAARTILLGQLTGIRRAARVVARQKNGLDRDFRLSPSGSDQALLVVAREVIAAATPYEREFIGEDLPTDFLAQLQNAMDDLGTAISKQQEARDLSGDLTRELDEATAAGLDLVTQIDALMQGRYAADQVTLDQWEQARRLDRPIIRMSSQGSGTGKLAATKVDPDEDSATPV
ncbi:MAG: hypothetical protein ACKV2V_30680 [Blastocatellia bacterium]